MASGAQVSEEAGDVGGEFEVPSSNQVIREPGEVASASDIRVASANQLAEGKERVGDLIGVSPANLVPGEVGTLGGEIGVCHADQVTEQAGGIGVEIGVASVYQIIPELGGVDGEIDVASVDKIIPEPGGMAGEIGVASVDQIIRDPEGLGAEIKPPSVNHVKEEAGASDGEISETSVNFETEEAGASSSDIKAVSLNHVTKETRASDSGIEAASTSPVNGKPIDVGGEIGMASVTEVIGEPGDRGGKVGVATAIQVNGKPEGQIGGAGFASANQVNMEPGGAGGENCLASANQMNGPPGDESDKFGVAYAFQVSAEPGSGSSDFGLASANQMNDKPGGDIGFVSTNQANREPGANIELASAIQVIGERGGDAGLASANQVNGEPECGDGEIPMASSNLVNVISRRLASELGVGQKHIWVGTKVYRRRPKGEKNIGVLSDLTAAPAKQILIYNGNGSRNDKTTEVNTHQSNQNCNTDSGDVNRVVESEMLVSVPVSGDNANLKQIQPATVEETITNKELIYAGMDCPTPIPVEPPVSNGAFRPDSASDSKVRINLASTAKVQLRDLKRKFENELYSVRKAVKRMACGQEEVVREFFLPVVNSSVLPNGARSNGFATQVYSGTRSLGHVPYKPNIRPFSQLRVSVVENGHCMVDSIEREKRTPKANQFYRNSEFLLANDKFPPAESNKKSKSNGKKSSGAEFGFGVGSKVYKSCGALLEKLMKHKHGWVFNAPVDVKGLGLHDYFLIIKNPMDLGTVKAKLIKYWYKSPMEFAEDVRLTFHNAMLYNPKGHDVHIMAETLLKIFEGKWPDIEVKYLRELRMAVEPDMGYPTPTSRINNPFQSSPFPPIETRVFNRSESMPHPVNPIPRTLTPAPSFRAPALKKPKAKDVNKRDMTYDEKQKLSKNLQSLPPEKLDGVIQIIKKRSTALSQNDEEIEVDIDIVDTETLWELDRFVTNYKKSLSKIRRKAELANQMRAEARQAAEKMAIPQPLPPKESTAGYGNAASSLPPHQNGPTANASGSSSSSSSSSSGSSSSDSDSDSSSEESDGGRSPGT